MKMKNYMNRESNWNAHIMIIVAAMLWGIIGIFTRPLNSEGFTVIQLTGLRCIVSAVFLGMDIFCTDRSRLKIEIKDLWWFICMGIFSILFFNICYFTTIRLSTLAVASVLLYTAPYFVVILSFFVFGEPLTWRKIFSLLLSFGGCMLVVGVGKGPLQLTAILSGIGAGFGYALFSIFGRIASRKYHPLTINFYTFMVAAICIIPFSGFDSSVVKLCNNWNNIINVLSLGIVSTAVPFWLYTAGLRHVESGKAAIMAFIEPFVASAVGVCVFQEALTGWNLIGMFLIAFSICLLNSPIKGRKAKS